jgi:hypothetical protein
MALAPITVRPTGQSGLTGWQGSSASPASALTSDNSDTTFVSDDLSGSALSGHQFAVSFPTPGGIPATAAIQKIVPRVRWQRTTQNDNRLTVSGGNNYPSKTGFRLPTSTTQTNYNAWTTVTLPASAAVLPGDSPGPADVIVALWLQFNDTPAQQAARQARISEIYLDVYYNEQPVPSAMTVSSTTQSSKPTHSWTFTDPEDDAQAGYRASVWLSADAADANCPKIGRSFVATDGTTRTAVACTGSGTNYDVLDPSQTWNPGVSYPNAALVSYVQVADQIGDRVRWSTVIASQSFTMAVTAPTAPSIATVTWNAVRLGYDITVTIPAWVHAPATTETVTVQRNISGSSVWEALPFVAASVLPGQAAQSVTVCDPLVRSNQQVRYRAYVVHNDGSWDYRSAYSASTAYRSQTITGFYLRNPLDPLYQVLRVQVTADLNFSSDEDLGVFWPAGGMGSTVSPSFVSGGIQMPSMDCPIMLRSEADYQTFVALRKMQTALFMQTDMDGVAYWGRLDASVPHVLLNSTDRRNALKRPRTIAAKLWHCRAAQRADGTVIGA